MTSSNNNNDALQTNSYVLKRSAPEINILQHGSVLRKTHSQPHSTKNSINPQSGKGGKDAYKRSSKKSVPTIKGSATEQPKPEPQSIDASSSDPSLRKLKSEDRNLRSKSNSPQPKRNIIEGIRYTLMPFKSRSQEDLVRQSVGDINCCGPSGTVSDVQNAMFRSTHAAAAAAVAAAAAGANEKAVSGSASSSDYEHPQLVFFISTCSLYVSLFLRYLLVLRMVSSCSSYDFILFFLGYIIVLHLLSLCSAYGIHMLLHTYMHTCMCTYIIHS